jgi:glycosyltransferase involved in cell wall biosynthesis
MPTICPVVIASNMFNEIDQLPEWFENFKPMADAGIVIVDSGSTDGTIDYCKSQGAVVIVDDIIRREGYGPARNHLREMARQHFPKAHWLVYFDADERVDEQDWHQFRYLKDYLVEAYDVIAFPRIDWEDKARTKRYNDYRVAPDWQARMTRLDSPLVYIRKLHEQVQRFRAIYAKITNPKINHFHRSAGQEKRDLIGKLCAKLHMEDKEFGHTMPEHPKEAMYREKYIAEGL